MREVKLVIKELEKGNLPIQLNFGLPNQEIDWDKVRYNTFYKSKDYFERKFPQGYESIPAFDKIVELMAENAKTPLEEITELQNIKND
jgi:hypothetical protein